MQGSVVQFTCPSCGNALFAVLCLYPDCAHCHRPMQPQRDEPSPTLLDQLMYEADVAQLGFPWSSMWKVSPVTSVLHAALGE